jgi:hypothetical protein
MRRHNIAERGALVHTLSQANGNRDRLVCPSEKDSRPSTPRIETPQHEPADYLDKDE